MKTYIVFFMNQNSAKIKVSIGFAFRSKYLEKVVSFLCVGNKTATS